MRTLAGSFRKCCKIAVTAARHNHNQASTIIKQLIVTGTATIRSYHLKRTIMQGETISDIRIAAGDWSSIGQHTDHMTMCTMYTVYIYNINVCVLLVAGLIKSNIPTVRGAIKR